MDRRKVMGRRCCGMDCKHPGSLCNSDVQINFAFNAIGLIKFWENSLYNRLKRNNVVTIDNQLWEL